MARRNQSTSSSRIELRFGGGSIDCLLDLATGRIERYTGDPRDFGPYGAEPRADGIHSRLGGKQYYQSRSGASGAGWVPAKPTLKMLGTYRVDVGGVLLGFNPEHEFSPHVGEFEIYAPFNYRGRDTRNYPIVVRERYGKITLLPEWQLGAFLRGEVETEVREFTFAYLKDSASGERKLVAEIHQPKIRHDREDERQTRLLVEGFHHAELEFVYPEGWQPEGDGEFWKRLGFRRLPDGLYKVVRGICRYMVDEWTDLAEIRKWVPANVHMLAPHLYIQERDGQYVGVGRFAFDGVWYDFESYLEPERAFCLFAGDREEREALKDGLEAGARNKFETERAERARAKLEAHQAEEQVRILRALCEQHADLEVTLEDSLAAGNCQPGTEDFRNREFPGKNSVTVRALSRFLTVYGVRRVLEHVLLPRAEGQIPEAPVVPRFTGALDVPQGETDDLTRVAGITKKIEQKLNDAGVYHFWQIAQLDAEQSAALDRLIRVKGAIEKDDWVGQAKQLVG